MEIKGNINAGYNNSITGSTKSSVVGGQSNTVTGDYSSVVGGSGNTASGTHTFIGGGQNNSATTYYSSVVGGQSNTASGERAFIGGGLSNTASGTRSSVVGGRYNTASGYLSFIGGGRNNTVSDGSSFIGGGRYNIVNGTSSFIGGGRSNTATTIFSSVVGGRYNTVNGYYSSVVGGLSNIVSGNGSFIGGGVTNMASGDFSFIGGGYQNTATTYYSSVVGGRSNIASGYFSSVVGGGNNTASGDYSSVVGGYQNTATTKNTSVVGGSSNIASSPYSFIGGGEGNTVSNTDGGYSSSVVGGKNNQVTGTTSFISGGRDNIVNGTSSSIVGGLSNIASGQYSSVVGGRNNTASAIHGMSSVVGGSNNTASGTRSSVVGGQNNSATTINSSVVGGRNNTINGTDSVIIGGQNITGTSNDTVYVPRLNVKSGVTLNQGTGVLNEAEDYGLRIGLNSPVSTDKTVILGDIYDLTSPPVTGVDNALLIGGSALGVQDIYFISQDRDNNTENYLSMGTNGAVIRHNDNSVSPSTKSQVQVKENILIESTTLAGGPDAIIDIVSRDEDSLLRSQLTVHKSNGIKFNISNSGGTLSEVIYGIDGFVGQTNELKFQNGNTLINLNSASNSVSISGATTNINSNAILAGNTGVANTLSFQGSDATINSPSANYLNLSSGYRIAFKTYSTLNAQLDSSTFYLYTHLNLADAKDIIVGSSSGTKIATSPSQKLGFWNATPVVQPSSATTAQGIADALTSIGILASGSTITGGGTVDYKYTTATTFTANVTKTITHSLNSEDIIVNIWEDSPKIQTDGLVEIVDSNTIKVTMGVTDTFKVVIIK